MSVMKRMYLVLAVLVLAFLAYQCGGNENKNYPEPEKTTPQTENPSNNENVKAGDPVLGKQFFDQTCSSCHGMDAKGLPKLGKDLTTSKFVEEKTDPELLEFVEQGRASTDPLNTTGVAMPPKGGNPALTDQQIMDIIAYVKQLHK